MSPQGGTTGSSIVIDRANPTSDRVRADAGIARSHHSVTVTACRRRSSLRDQIGAAIVAAQRNKKLGQGRLTEPSVCSRFDLAELTKDHADGSRAVDYDTHRPGAPSEL